MKELKNGNVRTTIYLPKELHLKFKEFCTRNDTSVTQTIIKHINTLLNNTTTAPTTEIKHKEV